MPSSINISMISKARFTAADLNTTGQHQMPRETLVDGKAVARLTVETRIGYSGATNSASRWLQGLPLQVDEGFDAVVGLGLLFKTSISNIRRQSWGTRY